MQRELRIGVITIQNISWPTLVERWQYLDELGFDSARVADHFTNYRERVEPSTAKIARWSNAAQTGRC